MILPLLLAAVGADLPPAPPADTTRYALSLDGDVVAASETFGSAPSNASGVQAGGNLDFTLYVRQALVDDDSPLSLQPYLQRTSTIGVHGGGLYLHFDYSPVASGGDYTQGYTDESVNAHVFVRDDVALVGSLGVNYLHDLRTPSLALRTTRDVWEPGGSLGVDVRSGDAGLTLGWQFVGVEAQTTTQSAAWRDVFWPRFSLAGRLVVTRRYDLTASVVVIPDGVEARAGIAVYPTKQLGFSAAVEGDRGQIFVDNGTDYDRVFGTLGASYWIRPRVSLGVAYTPAWVSWSSTNGQSDDEVTNQFDVSVTARLP